MVFGVSRGVGYIDIIIIMVCFIIIFFIICEKNILKCYR